jgi:hypothetical protein
MTKGANERLFIDIHGLWVYLFFCFGENSICTKGHGENMKGNCKEWYPVWGE